MFTVARARGATLDLASHSDSSSSSEDDDTGLGPHVLEHGLMEMFGDGDEGVRSVVEALFAEPTPPLVAVSQSGPASSSCSE